MEKLLESPMFWSVVYFVLVISRDQVKSLLKAIGEMTGSLLSEGKDAGKVVQKTNNQVFKTLERVLELGIDTLSNGIKALQAQIEHVCRQLSYEKGNLASRILGSLVSLIVMLTFLYADAALGLQAVQTLFSDITVPEMLRDIGMALIAASVGSIFALGMLFWDGLGFSDFTPVVRMKGFGKGIFIGSVLVITTMTLLCVVLIALNRASLIANLVDFASFSPAVQGEIHRWASLAQSLIVIPMLITTFMMLRGIYGLLVLYAATIGVVSLTFQFTRVLLKLLRQIVHNSGMDDSTASGILHVITNLLLMGLGWILGAVIAGAAALTEILQKLLDVITNPPVVIWNFVAPLMKQFLSRSTPTTSSSVNKSDEQMEILLKKLDQVLAKPEASTEQESLLKRQEDVTLGRAMETIIEVPRNNDHQ
ncbi:MAG: hypothetical protein M5U11_00150 [Anaerolineales bacterium]|nr:hypothetical protein [Anaerolineales bacterium]